MLENLATDKSSTEGEPTAALTLGNAHHVNITMQTLLWLVIDLF